MNIKNQNVTKISKKVIVYNLIIMVATLAVISIVSIVAIGQVASVYLMVSASIFILSSFAFMIGSSFMVKRFVLTPLAMLTFDISKIEDARADIDTFYGTERDDEFGDLSKAIQTSGRIRRYPTYWH